MKLVTCTGDAATKYGAKTMIKLIADAGFDGYDFTMTRNRSSIDPCFLDESYDDFIKEIRAYADGLGIPCEQCHAIFPTLNDTASNAEEMVELQKRCLEYAAILGAKVIVVHPGNLCSLEQNCELLYKPLLPLAKKLGVKIATENMWNYDNRLKAQTYPSACGLSDSFIAHVDYFKDEYLTACVDIGHAEMRHTEGADKLLLAMGDRVGALHVHDNNLINDNHWFPFFGSIEWEPIIEALKKINYDGNFTFECDLRTIQSFPCELHPAMYKLLEQTGRYFIKKLGK